MQFSDLLQSKKVRSLGSAIAAFLGYGTWAFYANHAHEFTVSLKAAMTQGGYSFVLTLTMAWMMETMYQAIALEKAKFPVTFVVTCLLLYSTSWGINALLGTPEILMTILPGAIIGSVYTLSYTLTLGKLQRETTITSPDNLS